MFGRLFGGSPVEPVPDDLRRSVEGKLFDFCYHLSLALGYAGQAASQSRAEGQDQTLSNVESNVALARATIDELVTLWPEGGPAIAPLRDLAHLLPMWLANFRAWQDYIEEYGRGKTGELDRGKYQGFVMANREYMDRVDHDLADARKRLPKAGVEFRSIEEQSIKKLMSDAEKGALP